MAYICREYHPIIFPAHSINRLIAERMDWWRLCFIYGQNEHCLAMSAKVESKQPCRHLFIFGPLSVVLTQGWMLGQCALDLRKFAWC
ncbi:MAG: hypothetical protein ACI8PV_001274 [Dinoroseobacter sp.]|jgi:hypothetical protein